MEFRLLICAVLFFVSSVKAADNVCGKCACSLDDSRTITLNCSRRAIDTLPTSWPQGFLEYDIEGNVLVTFYNNSITNLTVLPGIPGNKIAISFKNNQLSDIVDDAFQNLPKLFYLDLSNNALTGAVIRSEIFQGPYSNGVYEPIGLETLNLGYNDIHSLDRRLFQYTPNLTRLYLNNNPFDILNEVTILALASATNLEVLDLSNIGIKAIPLDAFQRMERIQQLDLSGNKFTIIPESLAYIGNSLEYLTFNENPIVELNDDSFIGLHKLRELEISKNKFLKQVKRSTFSPLTSLKTLHLCHNPTLSYISYNAFRTPEEFWTLEEVYLDDNSLSELPIDLMPWSKLKVLGMTGNSWLCECDLANIVTTKGAGKKFKPNEVPRCIAPSRLAGEYITDIPIDSCPDKPKTKRTGFSLFNIKPKHILWSIFGVAMVVLFGMLLGLFVNFVKTLWGKSRYGDSIRYINMNSRNDFA